MPQHRYQIKVRDPEGEPIGAVEFQAQSPVAAVEAARAAHERPASVDEDEQAGFPPGSEYVPEKLDAQVLYTVEVRDSDGNDVAAHEVAADSPAAAEADLAERVAEEHTVKAVAKRTIYPDSIIPLVNQGGPTPL